ncbi:3-dehydroquinate synthase [Ruminococcus albus]|uniref:3-dehydroquinate synthase n=1 Tax=Ruminococcus albus TaxID=1264 RepID=UPI000463EA26|nr:3-dehydroquinate synthase [Ruminococcus albus]
MVFRCELKKVVDDTYDIEIGHGLQKQLIDDLKGGLTGKKRFAVITDSIVEGLYASDILGMLRDAGFSAEMFVIPEGEKSKTRKWKEYLEDAMLEKGFRRDCAVIAVGGGVVTDLAGFVAGTFGRGVPFINYATTLLAAADASVGGKTAVDTPLATNLIGMFNQPDKVYIDIDTWKTLPRQQIANGLAETIKHGCLGDRGLFEYLEKNVGRIFDGDVEACEYIAKHNCEVKYNVVMQDERESGLREVLNLGHTVGRAVETVSDYELYHGEAVSIGMAAQARLGEKYGFVTAEERQRVEALLERAELPVRVPEYIDKAALVKKLYTDKKVRDGKLRFVFQKGIGEVVQFGENNFAKEIAEDEIAAVIAEM